MSKFNKGNTYICRVEGGKRWYIVHQSGQRTWTATVFTHTQDMKDNPFESMNGSALYDFFKNGDMRRYNSRSDEHQAQMRRDMFNILRWGQFDEPKKDAP